MKKAYKIQIIFIIISVICVNEVFTQTFIGLNIGRSYYHTSKKVTSFTFFKQGFESDFLLGLAIEQNISNKISVVLQSDFGIMKREVYWDYTHGILFNPISHYEYKSLNTAVIFKWAFFNNFHLGIGGGLTHLFDTRFIYLEGYKEKIGEEQQNILESIVGFSYYLKGFGIHLYYNHGFKFQPDGEPEFNKYDALVLSLGYRIKVFDARKKRKGKDCPTF